MLPAYKDIEDALLCYIYFHGGGEFTIKCSLAYKALAKFFRLTESDMKLCVDGERSKWENMVRWARRKLNDAALLDKASPRGEWKLSEKGVARARSISSKFDGLR